MQSDFRVEYLKRVPLPYYVPLRCHGSIVLADNTRDGQGSSHSVEATLARSAEGTEYSPICTYPIGYCGSTPVYSVPHTWTLPGPRIAVDQAQAVAQLIFRVVGKDLATLAAFKIPPSRIITPRHGDDAYVIFDLAAVVLTMGDRWEGFYLIYSLIAAGLGGECSPIDWGQFCPLPASASEIKFETNALYSWGELVKMMTAANKVVELAAPSQLTESSL
jgi:hypothetical protein